MQKHWCLCKYFFGINFQQQKKRKEKKAKHQSMTIDNNLVKGP